MVGFIRHLRSHCHHRRRRHLHRRQADGHRCYSCWLSLAFGTSDAEAAVATVAAAAVLEIAAFEHCYAALSNHCSAERVKHPARYLGNCSFEQKLVVEKIASD